MAEELLIPKIILVIISSGIIGLITIARLKNRTGNQFFIIMIIFWSGVFLIAIRPELLDSVLNSTGLVNRSQFLFSVSIVIILYLLFTQTLKSKTSSGNLNRVIRELALSNFRKDISALNEKKTNLIIIIVAKNEAGTIGSVIDKIRSLSLPLTYQIIVVNDGSTDKTQSISENKGALVVSHYFNLGIGAVVKTGFLAVRLLKPEIVINIDGDGQHDPKYIPEIISKIKDFDVDLVYASRFAKESDYKTTMVRSFGNKFYTRLVNRLAKISLTDVTSGYRGIRFEKLDSILFVSESNFAIELAIRAGRAGLKIMEIPTLADSRMHGLSQFHKIERFFLYNFNAMQQIINAYLKKPDNLIVH